jgi:hypothetical protein
MTTTQAARILRGGLFKVNGEILPPARDERAMKEGASVKPFAALPPDVRKACGFPKIPSSL